MKDELKALIEAAKEVQEWSKTYGMNYKAYDALETAIENAEKALEKEEKVKRCDGHDWELLPQNDYSTFKCRRCGIED